jgi:hypothetical protein
MCTFNPFPSEMNLTRAFSNRAMYPPFRVKATKTFRVKVLGFFFGMATVLRVLSISIFLSVFYRSFYLHMEK